jgi:DNA-binding response OmpR family regulator
MPVVLVLDDEKNIRNAIEIALSQEGIHVIGAHDVAAALRALHERIVDAMIVDIRLGEVGGLEFFRRASADGIAPPTISFPATPPLTEPHRR